MPGAELSGLRIAVDGRYARRPGVGINAYLKQVVRLLIDEGADVTLLVNFPLAEVQTELPRVRWLSFGSATNLVWEQWSLPRMLRRRRFDLYWAPANMGVPLLPTGRVKRLFTLHDLVPLRLPRMYLAGRPLYTGPYLVWTLSAIARSHAIITASRSSARDLHRLFRRSSVVASPVLYEDAIVSSGDHASAEPSVPAPGTRFVLYNGGRDPRKNVPVLLKGFAIAARRDPDLVLALMGHGYEELGEQIESLGIASNVVLTGYVSDADKVAIMKRATALLYPSLYEGFGLPLLEAFAHEVPVVTSPGSSLDEVAGDAAVYVDANDPESIAAGIGRVQDPELRERLRRAGGARWRAYDPAAARRAVLDTIHRTLDREWAASA